MSDDALIRIYMALCAAFIGGLLYHLTTLPQ